MGKNTGKTAGKIVFTVAGFFIGGMNPSMFGMTKFLPAAIMGASLGGTLWSLAYTATHKNKLKGDSDSAQRFDKAMNTMSSTAAIQVVYGMRLVEGNQTYHNPNPELNMLDKHVVLCEGGIEGLTSVMAAGLPIPIVDPNNYSSTTTAKTFFTVKNTMYENAQISFTKEWSDADDQWNYTGSCRHGDNTWSAFLGGTRPQSIPPYSGIHIDSFFSTYGDNEFRALFDTINNLGEGWVAENFNNLGNDYKLTDIKLGTWDCYQTAVNVEVRNLTQGTADIDTDGQAGTVFMVGNTKHTDAKVIVSDHMMLLYHGDDVFKSIKLGEAEDYDNSDYAQYELDISSLVSYINRIGEGWVAFPFASTNKLPHDIHDVNENCYNHYVEMKTDCVKGGTWYQYYDPVVDGKIPDNYAEVGSYSHCVWLDLHFTVSDELNGNPNIDVVVKGRKVLDTRVGEVIYSTNPAMCLRDFLLNDVFGVGWTGGIDEASFIEAADYCDEEIEYIDADGVTQTRKRYELNLILDQQQDAEEAVGKFLSACCGYLVRYRGIIGMRIEKPTPVSYHFTEAQIVKDSFAISQVGLDETPNRYVLNIISPENNWRSTRCIVEDIAMQEQLGVIQEESFDLDGVTSQQQALRIGRFYRDLNIVCNKLVSFSTAYQAQHLQPGDVIQVSYYGAIDKMPFRIISIKEEANGTFHIEGREYCEDIYTDELGAGIHKDRYTLAPSTRANWFSAFSAEENDGGISYSFSNRADAFNIPLAGYY